MPDYDQDLLTICLIAITGISIRDTGTCGGDLADGRLIAAARGTLLPAPPRQYGCPDRYPAEKARGNREDFLN
jgi:hypothetical protein